MNNRKHETLGHSVIPSNYRLEIEPGLKGFRFRGRVTITAKAMLWARMIVLNAKELRIRKASVRWKKVEQKATVSMDKKREQISLRLKRPVRGPIEIDISYEGSHNDRLYGFYRSKYTYKGKKGYIFTTQFEAPNARAALPCFDEPEFKATFSLSLVIDRSLDSISNMPIKSTKKMDHGKKMVTFDTTPKMSTYLLYMGVGRFERVSSSFGKAKVSVITVPGKRVLTKIPLEYSKRFIADLQSYFMVKYIMPKMDVIAIPDFAAGAMENWGAVTFREGALLCNDKKAGIATKKYIADVIAHEFAHQWFGDLVTMKWWNDMWLNESFATLMASLAVDRQFKEWKTMLDYRYDTIDTALSADGMRNTHPISMEVSTVSEIEKMFDAIGYEKGGSMLLMLKDYVGELTFRRGLCNYLKKHSYSNATSADLWNAIQEEAEIEGKRMPIKEMMIDWLERPGYPVVHVKIVGEYAELLQERFAISGNLREKPWMIPISYITEEGPGNLLFSDAKAMIPIKGKWIKLNYGQSGFYRVAYQDFVLDRLGMMVKDKKLGVVDGWGIENDLFASVRAGGSKVSAYLDFVDSYLMDSEYPLCISVSEHLNWITTISGGRKCNSRASEISLSFHKAMLGRLGWKAREGDDPIDSILRSNAISALGMLKDQDTVSKASRLFDSSAKGRSIDDDIKAAVYMTVAFNIPSEKLLSKLIEIYKNGVTPQDQSRAVASIGMLGDRKLVRKALGMALSKPIRLQDSWRVLVSAGSNPVADDVYRDWAMRNWNELMRIYSPSTHMLTRCVSQFGTAKDHSSREKIAGFFGVRRNLRDDILLESKKTVESIDANIRFLAANE
ncbi:MAG: M1 family metallopeptidase [Candidatus Marsarchaeota archaeon]|jgi:tricorn protease interacting factor F2/3|nr:M1 family metallopeptidase [Candidatus Marsarchaeota archaeon]MCL5111492.1 M1 family metallopeptidase [Candidatus Marsarchaeota archaeon]